MDLEDLCDRLDVVALDLHGSAKALGSEGRDAGPLGRAQFGGGCVALPLRDAEHEGTSEQVALDCDLLVHDDEGAVGQVFELEARIELSRVVGPTAGFGVLVGHDDGNRGELRAADDLEVRVWLQFVAVLADENRPTAMGKAAGGNPGRAVDGPHPHERVGGGRRGIEGRVLDVVAHLSHALFAEGLDVHQCAAMGQPELAVVG